MISKVMDAQKNFKGIDKLIFFLSLIFNSVEILKTKTILTMKFIKPVSVFYEGKKVKINHYYEVPFYTYNYEEMLNQVDKNTLLFDIGAHFGEITYRFLKKNKGYSYLFEPNPNNVKVIERLFSKENLENYGLFPVGLGNKNTKEVMHLNNPLSYEGSIKSNKGEKVLVNIKKIDSLKFSELKNYKKIFFKIDVEGYEIEAINGMISFLKNLKKQKKLIKLFIEIKSKENLAEIKKLLSKVKKPIIKKATSEDYLFVL